MRWLTAWEKERVRGEEVKRDCKKEEFENEILRKDQKELKTTCSLNYESSKWVFMSKKSKKKKGNWGQG